MMKKQNTEFGMVLALVLLVLSAWRDTNLYGYVIIALLISILIPVLYTPFSWLWFQLAHVLEKIMSSVILFFIFFMVVTPVGWIRRCIGKDNLQLNQFKKDKSSVFKDRKHIFEKQDMENQF